MVGKDAEFCEECKYHGHISGVGQEVTCDYFLIKKELRGCKSGVGCKRFEPKKKNHISLLKRPNFY